MLVEGFLALATIASAGSLVVAAKEQAALCRLRFEEQERQLKLLWDPTLREPVPSDMLDMLRKLQ
jgi:hypothetical protein